MSVIFATGFEGRAASVDGVTLTGTASISTTQARTGTASLRCNPASGATGYATVTTSSGGNWMHFGLYIAALPTVTRLIVDIAISGSGLQLTPAGVLEYVNGGVVQGTGSSALSTGAWHWIAVFTSGGSATPIFYVDGTGYGSGSTIGSSSVGLGCTGTTASAIDIYVDDVIWDALTRRGPSNVGLLVPTADTAVGTGWTLGTGTAISANSGSTAVKNKPPVGVADLAVGSDPKQIRNASANANVSYDATMATYTSIGIASGDAVLSAQPVISTAAPVTTSSKQGTVGLVSNPTITNVALGAGGTAGAFWSGVAANTFPTGWKASFGTLAQDPGVTVGTAPVMRVTQVTSSTRIAMVCFMGIVVAWTPEVAANPPYRNPMPPLLAQ